MTSMAKWPKIPIDHVAGKLATIKHSIYLQSSIVLFLFNRDYVEIALGIEQRFLQQDGDSKGSKQACENDKRSPFVLIQADFTESSQKNSKKHRQGKKISGKLDLILIPCCIDDKADDVQHSRHANQITQVNSSDIRWKKKISVYDHKNKY